MPNTALTTIKSLTTIKRHYPAFNEMDDHSFLSIIRNMTADPERGKNLLLQGKFSETPEDCQTALNAFRLPEGWGHSLRYFINQLLSGISEDISLTTIANLTGDPSLTLLLQIIQIYATFIEDENQNAHLAALMSNAQELLDLLKLVTKLRNGGPRLHQRIIDCVNRMLNYEW